MTEDAPDYQPPVVPYPNQVGDGPITAEQLSAHIAANPGMYDSRLDPHMEANGIAVQRPAQEAASVLTAEPSFEVNAVAAAERPNVRWDELAEQVPKNPEHAAADKAEGGAIVPHYSELTRGQQFAVNEELHLGELSTDQILPEPQRRRGFLARFRGKNEIQSTLHEGVVAETSVSGDVIDHTVNSPTNLERDKISAQNLSGAEAPPAQGSTPITNARELAGSKFLLSRNRNRHASREIQDVVRYLRKNGAPIPDKPADMLVAYAEFLADPEYVNDGLLTGNEASIERQIDNIVIKPEDARPLLLKEQLQMMHNSGYQDRDGSEIDPEALDALVEATRTEQKHSLQVWAKHLTEANAYPNWFKQYAWESMQKLGQFNRDTMQFGARGANTTGPFAELNAEALGYVYNALETVRIQRAVPEEEGAELQKLLQGGNFAKLYSYALSQLGPVSPKARRETSGTWEYYPQSEDPQAAERLANSLQGQFTGWCTAGKLTAAHQLKNGGFYIYHTIDGGGNPTVPRIAIRMEGANVGEIRGVSPGQELESNMLGIAMQQAATLPGAEKFMKRDADTKHVTAIEKLMNANPNADLSADDLRFLYTSKPEAMNGFADSRVDKLIQSRDVAHDMNQLIQAEGPENVLPVLARDSGGLNQVLHNLGKLNLSESMKRDLINSTMDTAPSLVAKNLQNIDKNLVDQSVLAQKIVENDSLYTLAENLKNFDKGVVDQRALVNALIEEDNLYTIAAFLDNFDEGIVDHTSFAHMILDGDQGYILRLFRSKFHDLPPAIMERIPEAELQAQ